MTLHIVELEKQSLIIYLLIFQIKEFLENRKVTQSFVYPCTVAAPPSIWTVNNSLHEPQMKPSSKSHRSERIKSPRKVNSSRIPLARNPKVNINVRKIEDEKDEMDEKDEKDFMDIFEKKERAALIIQRAYKKYKRKLLERKNSSSCEADSSSLSRHSSKNNKDQFRAPGPAIFEKLNLHKLVCY